MYIRMSLNLLNSLDAITIVQNNVDALHTLTINSIDNLGSELEKRYTKTDTDILLSTKEKKIMFKRHYYLLHQILIINQH